MLQAAQRPGILAQAVEQNIITRARAPADGFGAVRDAVERCRRENPEVIHLAGNATEREAAILAAIVQAQIFPSDPAGAFTEINDRLITAGLMPRSWGRRQKGYAGRDA